MLPTLIDVSELGEKTEPNALKWDKISKADYETYSNSEDFIPALTAKYKQRVKDDPVFKVIQSERDRYFKLKNGKTITLNYEKRKKIADEDDATVLKNTNIRLKEMGKPPVKSVKDLPSNFEFDDPILLETVDIASDYSEMIKKDKAGLNNLAVQVDSTSN